MVSLLTNRMLKNYKSKVKPLGVIKLSVSGSFCAHISPKQTAGLEKRFETWRIILLKNQEKPSQIKEITPDYSNFKDIGVSY